VPLERRGEALDIANTYRSTVDGLSKKLGKSKAFTKQAEGAKKEAVKEITKLGKKAINKGTEVVYRIIGDLAPADLGEAAFVELATGTIVNTYRLLLTFFKIQKRGVGDTFAKYAAQYGGKQLGIKPPEEKQSLLAAFLPSEMDLSDPFVWMVDIPVAIYGLFILLMIIGFIHLFLAMVGFFVVAGAGIFGHVAQYFGY
jgi:phenylpyruvate tautomerase PptA (4-oxalocrotonate tautomerase family)